MCTYVTEKTAVTGAGKDATGWFRLAQASVYVDHPYQASLEHSLNIDLFGDGDGARRRVAVELSLETARALAACIERALERAGAVGAG